MNYLNKQKTMAEMKDIVINAINDNRVNEDNLEDLHFHCFNEDYNIIGYSESEKWIEENFGTFNGINEVKEYEQSNFGEVLADLSDSEKVANMLYYIAGEEFISELDFETIEDLKNVL